jgi:hypothetical protein
MERATDAIIGGAGPDRGDELRMRAEALAYRAALDYEAALRDIEAQLARAALSGWSASDQVEEHALDIIRRHMLRGLYRAQVEAGESAVFWRLR